MTKKTRTGIFLLLFILFLIAAPITVLYSLGWRFDWESKKIIQPGMFYFKVWPRNTEVYLNGKLKKRTDIFFGSILIENLKSQNYNVEIKKEGYHSWQKILEISKRKVTEAKNIVLIPKNPGLSLISRNIDEFFFSPDKKKIILKENAAQEQKPDQWELKLFDTAENLKSHLVSQDDLKLGVLPPKGKEKLEKIELINLKFSFDSKKALIKVGAKERIYYCLLDLETSEITNLGFLENVETVFFHPDKDKIIVKSGQKIKEIDLKTKKELAILEDVIAIDINEKNIHYLDKEGFLFKADIFLENKEKLNIIPFEIKLETKYELKEQNNNILLKENDSLFIFDRKKMSFEKLLDTVNGFTISPDFKKICYFSEHEIWMLFLEKKHEQPLKEAGEKLFINRFADSIGNIFWYTDHYLIFNVKNQIKVAETDDRDKINIVDFVEFEDPKIFWANKKLYILSKNTLYASQGLLP